MLYLFTFQIKLPRQMMELSPQLTQLSYPQDFLSCCFLQTQEITPGLLVRSSFAGGHGCLQLVQCCGARLLH